MEKIIKKDGYVYLVSGDKGFETFYNLGKDYDYWNPQPQIENEKPKKRKNTKKEEE